MAVFVPVRWVAPLLYGVVLVGGLYYAVAGPGPAGWWRAAGFVAVLGALFALEAMGGRRPPPGCRCCSRGAL